MGPFHPPFGDAPDAIREPLRTESVDPTFDFEPPFPQLDAHVLGTGQDKVKVLPPGCRP
jgi:hypothetical protein